jgi:hypothetical protein
MFSTHKTLGLAVTEQGITAALVDSSSSGRTILRTAVMPFTDEINLTQPQAMGLELKRVLSAQGMGGGRCVIGLAATWIAAREKMLPPSDEESLRGMLAIASEREFASGAGDLAFDYCAMTTERGSLALLAAAPRQVVDSMLTAAKAAGLNVWAVTSSTLALAGGSRGDILAGGRLVLCLQAGGVELAVHAAVRTNRGSLGPSGPRLLRHLPVRLGPATSNLDSLCKELQRVMSLAAPSHDAQGPREVLVWDSLGLERETMESIGRQLGLPVRICKLPADLESLGGSSAPVDNKFAQAAAVAACETPAGSMDFLHSRLAPPPVSRFGRRTVGLAVAGAVVVLALAGLALDCYLQSSKVADLNKELDDLAIPSKEARKQVDDFQFIRGWYDHRPEFLDCLKEVSSAFPQEGRCWVTNLRTKEDMQVELSVKAVNQEAALELLDRLKSSPRLANVTPMFIRNTNDKSSEVSFDVLLRFRGGR